MTELKITAKKGTGFYIRAAATFLRGTEEKPPVPSVILSGTGPATTTVAETAHAIEKQGLAKITKVETGYPAVGGQSAARLAVTLTTDWPYPDASSYSNFDEVLVESYALEQEISFEKGILQGAIELHLLGVQETERMVLDTRGLDIKSITVDGAPGEYQLGTKGRKSEALGEALEVPLLKKLSPGAKAVVRIEYATAPDAIAIQMLSPEQTQGKKHPYLFTQCQAIHARCLMPCQDTRRQEQVHCQDHCSFTPHSAHVCSARRRAQGSGGWQAMLFLHAEGADSIVFAGPGLWKFGLTPRGPT